MSTAILGGSFNPVHVGHIELGREALKLGYHRIVFVPAANPPHKQLSGDATDAHRLAMLEIALENQDWGIIWDGEIQRGGTSYSIDTVRELKKIGLAAGTPGLIIGDDLLEGFGAWKAVEALVEEVEIILARRQNSDDADFPYFCIRMNNEIWPHSSTEVRRMIQNGQPLEGIVPFNVAEYIKQKGLYGGLG